MPTALPYIPRFQRPVAGDDGKAFVYDLANKRYVHGSFEAAGAVATHAALVSGVHGISAFGATLVDDANASAARSTLGLGTAATANTGTAAGNVVALDGSARLPAVDGSQLTNLPGGTPGGSDTYVQFNDGGVFGGDAGFTYAKATDALTVAGRVVTPVIRPASDSTTAIQVQTAGGSAVVTVDTTNARVGIGGTPNTLLQLYSSAGVVKLSGTTGNTGNQSIEFSHATGNNFSATGIFSVPTGASFLGKLVFAVSPTVAVTASPTSHPILTLTATSVSTQKDFSVTSNIATAAKIYLGPGMTNNAGVHGYYMSFGGGAAGQAALLSDALGSFAAPSRIGLAVSQSNAEVTTSDFVLVVDRASRNVGIGTISNPTALLDLAASTTTRASLRLRSGVAPTTRNDGDVWYDGTHLYMRIAGADKQLDN